MADSKQDELKLAQQMKDCYCDASGKETEPAKAAEIVHKIAVIYRKRSPDKIALIQSVGLFNAAIVRNPSNIARVKSDLNEICQHILQKAEANDQNVCLVKKAEQVKTQIEEMRTKVEAFLKRSSLIVSVYSKTNDVHGLISQKISEIREINKTIAHTYKQIMADVSEFSENVMGKPPCEYAVVGMGSLARDEITPYSDFEHIILLCDDMNYKTHLEYFRWFSVIFHVIILNLQETIIPSLNVHCLNTEESPLGSWFFDAITPRGISFDGLMPHACKFPLGRTQLTQNKPFTTELIKPVNEMLEYLSSEADLKNGYHLADMLTKTCFVSGNKHIFKKFVDGVQMYRNKQLEQEKINDLDHQVKDDLNRFSTRFQLSKLKSQNKINIKQLVYRSTTIFISALAALHKISANSSFDIIDKMEQNNNISKNTANKLRYGIAIATELRLRVYMKSKCQNDTLIDINQRNGMENFLNIVGTASTISYFQIAYCLQCEIAKQLNFTKLHFYSNPKLINVAIGLAFGLSKLPSFSETPQHRIWYSTKFEFDTCILELETDVSWDLTTVKTTDFSLIQYQSIAKQVQKIADYLKDRKIYDEALEFYENLQIYQNIFLDIAEVSSIATTLDDIGLCHEGLCNYSNALSFLKQALLLRQNKTFNADEDDNCAASMDSIGRCHIGLWNYSDALRSFKRALEIQQNIMLNSDKSSDIASLMNRIGVCHIHLRNYSEGLTFLNRGLEISQNKAPDYGKCKTTATLLHNIGRYHKILHNYSDAVIFLNRALEIYKYISLNFDEDDNIATTLQGIGSCNMHLSNYSDALTFLNRALKIFQNITLSAEKNSKIAKTLKNIGSCNKHLGSYSNALIFLNRALKIYRNTSPNANKHGSIAATLNSIGSCHMHSRNYYDALTFFNRSLEILQNKTLNADEDSEIAKTLHTIGVCNRHLGNYSDALTFLNRALEIEQNTTSNADEDRSIATSLNNIGTCHMKSCNFTDALTFFNRALKIEQKITLSADKSSSFAKTLTTIKFYLKLLLNYVVFNILETLLQLRFYVVALIQYFLSFLKLT